MKPCPLCSSTGPWSTQAERTAHIRAHHTADCEQCGATVNASGLDAHKRIFHPDPAPEPLAADVDEPAAPGPAPDQDPEPLPPAPAPEPAAPATPAPAARKADVECPECKQRVRPTGLGNHRAGHRRAAERAKALTPPPPGPTIGEVLAKLLPGTAGAVLDTLAEFVDRHQPDAGDDRWIVAPLNGTPPRVCRTAGVGLVVAHERGAALVVAVGDIYAHLRSPARVKAAAS